MKILIYFTWFIVKHVGFVIILYNGIDRAKVFVKLLDRHFFENESNRATI